MGYTALEKMSELNFINYGIRNSVNIPKLPKISREYGKEVLSFIRNDCENLFFDLKNNNRAELKDLDGKSSGLNQIPFNMEKDLDRLSFEKAIARFLNSGSREDAFDIYYCYCEIFKPFGEGYESTGLLLEMLSEHETNASSLLMKHRDHYSHSVYVFLIGISIFKNSDVLRKTYKHKYNIESDNEASCHFLKHWGLTSLFHDIGYPFEIAHQQMKAYVCQLDDENNDVDGFAPYVSFNNMDRFTNTRVGDLNKIYANEIDKRLSKYIDNNSESSIFKKQLLAELKDRGIHKDPNKLDYLYMDHAYFSGLILFKTYLKQHQEIKDLKDIPSDVIDCFVAIVLHNSLFKFTIRGLLKTKAPLSLNDGEPLAYLLMLCDELQCFDRKSYGQNSRGKIYAYDFDIDFKDDGMKWIYYFDKAYSDKVTISKSYLDMSNKGYKKKSGAVRVNRSKFVDDIDEIISIADLIPTFESDVNKEDLSSLIETKITTKKKQTGLLLSDTNYLNLYYFALALNGRYCGAKTEKDMKKAFEDCLSLEYKISNIAQAKGFAKRLEELGMFYTDRPIDYERVIKFSKLELKEIAEYEHRRWINEKIEMGWNFGNSHLGGKKTKYDNIKREKTRLHHDIVPFNKLTKKEIEKDFAPMQKMLELIKEFDGLTIYRV